MSERPPVRYSNMVWDSARWDGFALRPDDIIVSTPPKSGTTWTQMICALLIFQTTTFDQPLSRISPWFDMLTRPRGDVVADLDAQQHRRFIKTHTPLDGLPRHEGVTYIDVGRDPRDVAMSMANHRSNMNLDVFFARLASTARVDKGAAPAGVPQPLPGTVSDTAASDRDRFWGWIDDPTPPTESTSTLLRTVRHHEIFWNERGSDNVVMLHYDDLQDDLEGQMRALADRLGIAVADDRWPALVETASFEHMRENADSFAPNADIWHDKEQFFHRGTSGQWRGLLDDDDLRRYHDRVAQLVAPDLAAWIHHER